MGLTKISNIVLTVTDLEKALDFYRDILGMKVNATLAGEFAFLNGVASCLLCAKEPTGLTLV